MAIGLIIIGDEILSGKRQDKHFGKVVEILAARGLQLGWAEFIGDDRARITDTLRRTLAGADLVFSCGGIGATPDDHTRQCAAAALGVPLQLQPEAKRLIEERIADMARAGGSTPDLATPENQHRLEMGKFPQGAGIVPNPYNKIPGFSLQNKGNGESQAGVHCVHYFVPGFPVMAWPMIEWALDMHHADLFHRVTRLEKSVLLYETMESTVTPLMEAIEAEFPGIKVFSLPNVGDAVTRRHIELGVKGEAEPAGRAFERLLAGLGQLGVSWQYP